MKENRSQLSNTQLLLAWLLGLYFGICAAICAAVVMSLMGISSAFRTFIENTLHPIGGPIATAFFATAPLVIIIGFAVAVIGWRTRRGELQSA